MALNLTKPVKTAKSKKTTYSGPEGADKLATLYRDLTREKNEIEARLKIARDELLDMVSGYRKERLVSGSAEGTITLPTADDGKVLVIFQERYTGLPDENIPELQSAFGDKFDLLVEINESVKFQDNATSDALKKAAGDRFDAVMNVLEVSRSVTPRKGAYDQVARAFREGEHQFAEELLQFVESCVTSPQVRT